MKKLDLKKLAMIGITAGLILSAQGSASEPSTEISYNQYRSQYSENPPSRGNGGQSNRSMHQNGEMMSDQELMQELDARHKEMYNSMSPEGKELARKLASQDCKGKNDCKGLGSCKSDKNACAGKNGCQGQSKGPFTDKNKAVEVARAHMQEKRSNMQNPQSNRNPYQQRQNSNRNY